MDGSDYGLGSSDWLPRRFEENSQQVPRHLRMLHRNAVPLPGTMQVAQSPLSLSTIERLPAELIEMIAAFLLDDSSLRSFSMSCRAIAYKIIPADSGIWRKRFLERYDYPLIEKSIEFSYAYQYRQLVLERAHYLRFCNPGDQEHSVMRAIRGLVIESFNPTPLIGAPKVSKNVEYLSSSPSWETPLHSFLLCSEMYNALSTRSLNFHDIRDLHAALRLTLGFLFLNPVNQYHGKLYDPRSYDLKRIYLSESEFTLIVDHRNSRAANSVNLVDLIHILNFWNNHFCNPSAGSLYREMALDLSHRGRAAKAWKEQLSTYKISDLPTKWIGHYTCHHASARNTRGSWEQETCAELWNSCDPLTLDFSYNQRSEMASRKHKRDYWPRIFKEIPAFYFDDEIARRGRLEHYFRGIAYHVDLDVRAGIRYQNVPSATVKKPKDKHRSEIVCSGNNPNALSALRLHGISRVIKDQMSIPGWASLKMVIYAPTNTHMMECLWTFFGDLPCGKKEVEGIKVPSMEILNELEFLHSLFIANVNYWDDENLQNSGLPPPIPLDELDAFEARIGRLVDRIILTPNELFVIDKAYYEENPSGLTWDAISYAYAYEGIVTPGGTLILGRFFQLRIADMLALDGNIPAQAPVIPNGADGDGSDDEDEDDVDYPPISDFGVEMKDIGGFVFWPDEGRSA